MSAAINAALRLIAKETCRALRKSETPAETILWQVLRDRLFQELKFYRQYPILVDWLETETFFVADFYCFERRLVVEVDGKIHDYRTDHDELRTFIINHLGIHVVRVSNEEIVRRLHNVLARLTDTVLTVPKMSD